MFQSFETTSRPEQGPPRLAMLREAMAQAGLDGVLVPRADRFQGEYVAACDDRLAWLTGFTGSAGFCAVLPDVAGVFIDGRYRVQVRAQVDGDAFSPVHWPETGLADWLAAQMPGGGVIGFDPWLHTMAEIERLRAALPAAITLIPTAQNLIDQIWHDRPAAPTAPFFAYPDHLAGETHAAKRAHVAQTLQAHDAAAAVISLPDSVAWLLNIRGRDIARNPVPHAFAILDADGRVQLFSAPGKTDEVLGHLGADISILPIDGFSAALTALGGPVMVDKSTTSMAVGELLAQAGIAVIDAPDPCALPKARKNATELAGTRAAHLRDGAAMVEFLAWLDAHAPGDLTEISVVRALESARRATNLLQDISFDTIAGTGPHGAIVHYRVTEETNRPLRAGELLLIDSGGQYLDGTTDITRTIAIGPAGAEERACFTRVLRGMIALSAVRFPKGLSGRDLDALARAPLWAAGQDYDHGTGHGVGVYLCVHEGPQRISRTSTLPLEPGMIVSNEPGYYREGAFGIRIENLITVREAPPLAGADDRAMYDFETLTFVPIDRRLIEADALSQAERTWLNAYHTQTRDALAPLVTDGARAWLEQATAPI